MRTLPFPIGILHFVGIGGIGMSGIAEILNRLGYQVQGSDIAENAHVVRLRKSGIKVNIGHRAENIENASVVIVSTAIKKDNPEVLAAKKKLIPVIRRAEMLAELMRLRWSIAVGGTHGKTTTTSLIAAILEAAQIDPTVINGGIISSYGSNTRMGEGEWMVVESDESDGTFVRLPSIVSVVTSMDNEHMDHWQTPEKMEEAYYRFITNVPFYGYAILCIDHPSLQHMLPRLSDRRIITYGCSPQADIRAEAIEMNETGATFHVIYNSQHAKQPKRMGPFHLPMFGMHNVQNSLAAIAIATIMHIPAETIERALSSFKGVKRRFTCTGEVDGITIIDDYAHHPIEIEAVIKAARQAGAQRLIVVIQPHRYSRVKNLFSEFCTCMNNADIVIVSDIYAGGETPIDGIHRQKLIDGLKEHGHRHVLSLGPDDDLARVINDVAQSGDYVLCLGAGSITHWAYALPEKLTALREGK